MEIQPADLAQRRRVMIVLGAAAVVLIAIAIAFEYWLRHALTSYTPAELVLRVKDMLFVYVVLIAICLVALGVHFVLRGRRIVADGRYPARDARVVRDTPVREGAEAVRIGNVSQATGAALCIAGLAVAFGGIAWVAHFG
ncbi:MAG TPA: hypothetical protein VFB32_12740 [Rudaea sp.]|nr:hypothetical protein [Rudaea sp.]